MDDPATPPSRPLAARLAELIDALASGLIERDEHARLVLLAALAGEHALLLGPPGTAKSLLARRLHRVFDAAPYFERLLTRFTVPEELFGPLSIKALERDEFVRRTEGYLPRASVAFLDEVFKANSAILNALLTLLQEREFDNGTVREPAPLVCLLAASNELPEADELGALFDRFLVRLHVGPVSSGQFDALLAPDACEPTVDPSARIAPAELVALRAAARSVQMPAGPRALLRALREHLADRSSYVSDRRWRKIAGLLQVAAHTEGRASVSLLDCRLAIHCVWSRPDEREELARWFDRHLVDALEGEPHRYHTLIEALGEQLATEAARTEPVTDAEGREQYRYEDGSAGSEAYRRQPRVASTGEALYRPPIRDAAPSDGRPSAALTGRELFERYFPTDMRRLAAWINDPANLAHDEIVREALTRPAQYAAAHVGDRARAVASLDGDLRAYTAALEQQGALRPAATRLWLVEPPSAALGALEQSLGVLRKLTARLDELRAVVATLRRSEP